MDLDIVDKEMMIHFDKLIEVDNERCKQIMSANGTSWFWQFWMAHYQWSSSGWCIFCACFLWLTEIPGWKWWTGDRWTRKLSLMPPWQGSQVKPQVITSFCTLGGWADEALHISTCHQQQVQHPGCREDESLTIRLRIWFADKKIDEGIQGIQEIPWRGMLGYLPTSSKIRVWQRWGPKFLRRERVDVM